MTKRLEADITCCGWVVVDIDVQYTSAELPSLVLHLGGCSGAARVHIPFNLPYVGPDEPTIVNSVELLLGDVAESAIVNSVADAYLEVIE